MIGILRPKENVFVDLWMELERDLVRAVIEYIQLRGGLALRINSGLIVIGDGQRVMRGAPAGTADVIACLPGGRFAAIECKVGKNRPTALQEDFLETVKQAGGLAIVAWSIEDLAVLFEKNGR